MNKAFRFHPDLVEVTKREYRDGKIFEHSTSWGVDGIPTYTLREVK
tara:strand:+ start:280 stop:417 length:138 start_codon:yes stop_codon:yes gene_type:complete